MAEQRRNEREQKEMPQNSKPPDRAAVLDFYKEDTDTADKARETYKLWISLNPFNFKGGNLLD